MSYNSPFSGAEVDDAVTKRHEKNKDTKLDEGGANETTAQETREHIDATDNPHGVTKTQVGLGDVDNVSAADLRDRSTHTGTQPLSTISDAGTIASQDANSVNIDGGTIDSTAVNATTLTASGDVNFDSGTLFVDSSENRVGIGTTSPVDKLDVAGDIKCANILSGSNQSILFRNDESRRVGIESSHLSPNSDLHISARGLGMGWFGRIKFYTSGNSATLAERMRIDSSGNVGIGTSSPSGRCHVSGTDIDLYLTGTRGTGNTYSIRSSGTNAQDIELYDQTASQRLTLHATDIHAWYIGGNERMRIDSGGQVEIGTSTKISGGFNGGLAVHGDTDASGAIFEVKNKGNPLSGRDLIRFYNSGNGEAGSIEHTSYTSVSYLTSSDYRLKENIQTLTGALDKVQAMNPVTYDWKAGGEGEGFIAHELQEIAPYAVSGEKDGEQMQGVDYGKLTTLLVGAVKELTAEVEKLKAQLGANNGN